MRALFIEGRRSGYSPEQIRRTMTVRELIGWLEQFDEETPVLLKNDNGFTYGSITESSFTDSEDEEEEDYE